jgi:hypothetical protein
MDFACQTVSLGFGCGFADALRPHKLDGPACTCTSVVDCSLWEPFVYSRAVLAAVLSLPCHYKSVSHSPPLPRTGS